MGDRTKTEKRDLAVKILAATAAIVFIIIAFVTFTRDNHIRIVEQNNRFTETATRQTADRMNDMLSSSMSTAQMMAHLYESALSGAGQQRPTISPEILQDMASRSPFDYIEFISADGMDLTADGQTADLSDREYFISGMRGESGRCVVHNSRITNETLLIFYSPFYYNDEIIGVLSCIMRGETLDDLLEPNYFGVQGTTYMVDRNGDVILFAGEGEKPDNLLDYFRENGTFSAENQEKLDAALKEGNSVDNNSFNYRGTEGDVSAYVTVLDDGEWALVQCFPSSVTTGMIRIADSAGIHLEVKLIIAFLAYLVFLIVRNRRQKRRLISEKQEMSHIVGAVSQLFTRFSLVDFENDTYQYLERGEVDAPKRGQYSELIRYLETKYVDEHRDGEKMAQLISAEDVRRRLTEDVPYLQYEYEIDMGGLRWENMSVFCLRRKDGVAANVLFAIQDVTALKKREQEIRLALKNSSEAAESANRAKTDFLARMSHDIRTPMNAIMGMTAVAAMHMDDRERLTDCLSKITISSRHLLALINDVLDMSKIESGKMSLTEEPFGMSDMVDSVVAIIRPQVNGKNQTLKVLVSDIAHENVIGDLLRLRQVFVNILGNAVKFTPEGGTITFSIRESESSVHGMACYEFICEDTGIGMDEKFLETIFDPFSRSEQSVGRNIEGTGLGMSITRNIVQMMEGDIRVESKVGVGSKFTVTMHLKLQEQNFEDSEELAGLRVLVADDDRDCCVSTCEVLKSIGMESEWVLSGAQAVRRVVEEHGKNNDFAAVILDWKMPEKDGVETAREIRSSIGDDVPIIILSAYDWSDVEDEAREAGIQAFVEKPLFRSRLVYALKSVLSSDAGPAELAADAPEAGKYGGKRILLVEDNELNMEIAQELLSHIGIESETASNGEEAVRAAEQAQPGHFDLIFMDIQMPVMNGYDAARKIRSLGREDLEKIPIVAMTANAFSDDIQKAIDAGMNDHIAKPVEIPKLVEILDKWLRSGK